MRYRTIRRLGAAVALLVGGMTVAGARQVAPRDQSQLVQQVAAVVVQKLETDGVLDRAVDAGIERYIAKEEAAQAAQRRQHAGGAQKAGKVPPVSLRHDHIFGNPHAQVSIIEYADFECPYCKRFNPVPRKLVEHFGGKVNWVYRYFPLGFHNPSADTEAEAAECMAALGGNDAFWKYADLLYANTRSNGDGVPFRELAALAAGLGVDKARFSSCLKSHRHAKRIQREQLGGEAAGIRGTPSSILRNSRTGQTVRRVGALPYADLKADIDGLLK